MMKRFLDFINPNRGEDNNRQKIKTMALSLFFAVSIWLLVVYIYDPSIKITLKNVDVRFTGEMELKEKGLVLTGKDKLPSMAVSVSGKRSDLIDYMDNVYISINLDSIDEVGEYELRTSVDFPASRLSLEKNYISKVKVKAEHMVAKDIQVITKQAGSNKAFLVKSEIENDYVKIFGAQSEIEKIAYGAAVVDISAIETESEASFPYVFYDSNNNQITGISTIEAESAVVRIKNTPYFKTTLPLVPVLSSGLGDNIMINYSKTSVSPSTVEVGIDGSFKGESVAVNVDKLTDNETEFYLIGAEGLYIPDDRATAKVKPVIIGKQTKVMKLPVTALNIPENTAADFVQEIEVTVECADGTKSEDLKAEIDLSGLDKGTHKVPVKISGEGFASATPVEIDVTVK